MDQFKAMQCFVLVAELGSFSAVADRLSCPVSTVSRQIRALEGWVKAELITRSTRRNQLTEIGHLYLQECRQILQSLNHAHDLVSQYQQQPSGRLRITAMASYGEQVIAPLLGDFQACYPDIVLDFELSDRVQDVHQANIDLAFRGGALPDERLVAYKLEDNHFCLVAAPSYLARHGYPANRNQLEGHKGLFYRAPAGELLWRVIDQQQMQVLKVRPALITNSGRLLIEKLLMGEGLAMLPRWAIRDYLQRDELVEIEQQPKWFVSQDDSFGVYMLYQKSRYEVPKIRVAVDYFRQALSSNTA